MRPVEKQVRRFRAPKKQIHALALHYLISGSTRVAPPIPEFVNEAEIFWKENKELVLKWWKSDSNESPSFSPQYKYNYILKENRAGKMFIEE